MYSTGGKIECGCLDSVEYGTVEWNSGTMEWWNSGMAERAIDDPLTHYLGTVLNTHAHCGANFSVIVAILHIHNYDFLRVLGHCQLLPWSC